MGELRTFPDMAAMPLGVSELESNPSICTSPTILPHFADNVKAGHKKPRAGREIYAGHVTQDGRPALGRFLRGLCSGFLFGLALLSRRIHAH